MSTYQYVCAYGSTPSTPISVYVLDGNFAKQLLAGITTVTITVWPAQSLRMLQPTGAPIITAAAATFTTDGSAAPGPYTLLQYLPTHADALHGPGAFCFQFTVNSSGGRVDIIPDNNTYAGWLIGAAGP